MGEKSIGEIVEVNELIGVKSMGAIVEVNELVGERARSYAKLMPKRMR